MSTPYRSDKATGETIHQSTLSFQVFAPAGAEVKVQWRPTSAECSRAQNAALRAAPEGRITSIISRSEKCKHNNALKFIINIVLYFCTLQREDNVISDVRAISCIVNAGDDETVISLEFLPDLTGGSKLREKLESEIVRQLKPLGTLASRQWRNSHNFFAVLRPERPAERQEIESVIHAIAAGMGRQLDLMVVPPSNPTVTVKTFDNRMIVRLSDQLTQREASLMLRTLASMCLQFNSNGSAANFGWTVSYRRQSYYIQTSPTDAKLILGGWGEGFGLDIVRLEEDVDNADLMELLNMVPLESLLQHIAP